MIRAVILLLLQALRSIGKVEKGCDTFYLFIRKDNTTVHYINLILQIILPFSIFPALIQNFDVEMVFVFINHLYVIHILIVMIIAMRKIVVSNI